MPKPLQKPHPPIWVAARDPGTFDWAVGIGANILSTPLSAPAAEIAVLGEKFRKAVADHPEVPRPRFMMQRRTCVYDTAEDWEIAVQHSMDYGRAFENLFQNIGTVKTVSRKPSPTKASRATRQLQSREHPQEPDVRHARRGDREAAGL